MVQHNHRGSSKEAGMSGSEKGDLMMEPKVTGGGRRGGGGRGPGGGGGGRGRGGRGGGGGRERKRFGSGMLLALKVEEETMSQGMQVASRY